MEVQDDFEDFRARALSGGSATLFFKPTPRGCRSANCSDDEFEGEEDIYHMHKAILGEPIPEGAVVNIRSRQGSLKSRSVSGSPVSTLDRHKTTSRSMGHHHHYTPPIKDLHHHHHHQQQQQHHHHHHHHHQHQGNHNRSRNNSLRDRENSGSPRSQAEDFPDEEENAMDHYHDPKRRSQEGSPPVIESPGISPRSSRSPSLAMISRAQSSMHRVKRYSITPKGLVNEGDSYISSKSSSSLASIDSHCCSSSAPPSVTDTKVHRVFMIGDITVGKRSIIQRFTIPEMLANYSTSIDDETEKTVSILLDGEESTLEFVDVSNEEVDQFLTSDQVDAYVIVYSIEDRKSFEGAIDRLYELRKEEDRQVAVILVANKTDLVRSRIVLEEEGKSAAKTYDCKYIEVSAAIDHKVDELLVGILKQIRLINKKKTEEKTRPRPRPEDTCCLLRTRQNVLGRLLTGNKFTSKSCENLYVL